jgi:hypothetical protein
MWLARKRSERASLDPPLTLVLAGRGSTDCPPYYQINRFPNTRDGPRGQLQDYLFGTCCGLIARVEVVHGTLLDIPQGTSYLPLVGTHGT